MQNLTAEGLRAVTDIAARNGVSLEAAQTLLTALAAGNGNQAQFHHPDLGGMGQWSRGGMIMIGDMFNQDLKYRVDRICNELAALLQGQSPFQSFSQGGAEKGSLFAASASGSHSWWPEDLGVAASVGAQNDMRYAYFPNARRLAIMRDGQIRVYDSGEHRISGFSQAQSGDQKLTFTSQLGLVRVDDLALVSPHAEEAPTVPCQEGASSPQKPNKPPTPPPSAGDDIFAHIERLAELRQKNVLTDEEFAEKKRDLLSRL
jgi:hypothetical protein